MYIDAKKTLADGRKLPTKQCVEYPTMQEMKEVIEHLGYGRFAEHADGDTLRAFLEAVPQYEERLAGYEQRGNEKLFAALDERIDQAAAGLY